ncbi:MAG TPA: tyrosine-type recombinase/integrase [Candidatus Angelobacter sp.]|jgi:integrase|nr:tyrosine-type recombinase/integrase [Candidatus Angelobacter sp.]
MRSRPKGRRAQRVVRHTLADGTVKEYRYAPHKPKRRERPADTIDALIEAYRRSPEWHTLAENSRRTYATYLREIEKVGHIRVAEVRRRDLLIARDAIMQSRGRGAAQGFIRSVSALLSWAVDREWIDYSPANRIKALSGGHLRAWSAQEADKAQAELPEHLRRVVVLARYTGQRRGDLCAMTWSAFDGESIRVKQQKTGEELVIPCHPALRAELARWREEATSVSILTNTLGRPWRPVHLSHELPVALARLEMPAGLNVHGLRKLAATSLADAGCTPHEIAAVTGHRTLAMVALYTRGADQERLASAAIVRLQTRDKLRENRKLPC